MSKYSRKNKGKKEQRRQQNTNTKEEKAQPALETVDFYGHQIPKQFEGMFERRPMELVIKQGFVPGMKQDAIIFCNDELLELLTMEMNADVNRNTSCIRQAANVSTLPSCAGSLAMPDAHCGYGFSIGGVAAMRLDDPDAIICPGGVGFDINCGVRLIRTNLTRDDIDPVRSQLADALFANVPSGVGTTSDVKFTKEEFDQLMVDGLQFLVEKGYAWEEDLKHCEEHGKIAGANPSLVSANAKSRGCNQVGTLGSGNHYLEVQVVDEIMDEAAARAMGITQVGQICIMVHCGSRGLGHQVCQDYVNVCLKDGGVTAPIDKQLTGVKFNSQIGQNYYSAMNCCANFAFANRGLITHKIRQTFHDIFKKSPEKMDMHLVYDVCHNIAKVETHTLGEQEVQCIVHRKGATRAFPPHHPDTPEDYQEVGQPAIIGGSMGTCSYVLVGTEEGMKKSFGSTCHGAGRKLSRVKAMQNLTSNDVIRGMKEKGIELRITDPKLAAEECDEAYKDVTDVVETCQAAGISKIVMRLRPLIVVKG